MSNAEKSVLLGIREHIEKLEVERDEGSADAERQTAGMKEVALFRAANAAACLGRYARPLLEEAESLQAALLRTRGVIDELYDGVSGLDDPTVLARLRNFFEAAPGSGYHKPQSREL